MQNFKELMVWKKAHQLTLDVYRATKDFPVDERFGLTSQLRRSAASVPANIAEGTGRGSNRDFARFLVIANGSAVETEYHLILARDLDYLTKEQHAPMQALVDEVQKMLGSLIRKVDAAA